MRKIMKNKILILTILVAIAIVSLLLLNQRNSRSTLKPDKQDFAIIDPDAVDKIFMTKKSFGSVLLTKKNGLWYLNDSFLVNEDKLKMLLYETAPQLSVKGPVPKEARNTVIRYMAALGTKVEFYGKGDLIKTYYVGGTTPDQLATNMWMEGAAEPYVVHIPGFTGYLNSRYLLDPDEWLSKELFNLPTAQIKILEINYPAHPEWSFTFTKKDGSIDITVDAINEGKPVNVQALTGYFGLFQNIYAEGYPKNVTKEKVDSLLKVKPYCILSVSDMTGKTRRLIIHRRPRLDNMHNLFDKAGKPLTHDPERYYAFMDGNSKVMLIQDLVFKNILIKYQDFLVKP
jgi:hypothetical protein